MKKKIIFITLILSLFLIVGCTQETEESTNTPNQPQETKEFDLTASNWKFEPSTLNVNQGDKVILHVTSIDVEHGIVLNDFGVSEDLTPGETTTIEFTADKKGEFLFFCNVYCGLGHSDMEGTLIIK
jgi:cytochrome c oxidase subunit 2